MSETPLLSIFFFLLASALGALGQFLYRAGSQTLSSGISGYFMNWRLLGGIACYIAVMILFVQAFKRGGSVRVLYPIYATTFIWAALISRFTLGSPIRAPHVLGMLLLLAGIYMMSS